MFYVKDLIFRIFYILYIFLFLIIFLFLKKEIVLFFINVNLTKTNFITIIYSSPTDLLLIYLYLIGFLTLLIVSPYVFWTVLDFYKSSLTKKNYLVTKYLLFFSFLVFLTIVLIFFIFFLPLIWEFFEKTNTWIEKTSYLTFFQQLHFDKYFLFIQNFIFIFNYFYLFILILFLISFKFKTNLLLIYRKIFLILNLVVATLVSPPDIFSQICLFFIFTFIFEILCLFFLTLLKYFKNLFIFNFITTEKN
jgi:sec-independent protein translocase protein TatC